MNERMLQYCLRETAVALRMMAQSKSPLHVFNYGTRPDTGEKYVFVLAILPEDVAHRIFGVKDWEEAMGTANAEPDAGPTSPEAKTN